MHLGRWEEEEQQAVATITSNLAKKIPVVVHTIPHPAIM